MTRKCNFFYSLFHFCFNIYYLKFNNIADNDLKRVRVDVVTIMTTVQVINIYKQIMINGANKCEQVGFVFTHEYSSRY